MLLGLVVDNRGLVPEADVKRLREFGTEIEKTFSRPLAQTSGEGNEFEVKLNGSQQLSYVIIQENIAMGERVLKYRILGLSGSEWQLLSEGSCIGHKRIEKINEGKFSAIKLIIEESQGTPQIKSLACY